MVSRSLYHGHMWLLDDCKSHPESILLVFNQTGSSYGQPKLTLLAPHMVSRRLPFWQLIWSAEAYPSYIERAWYLHMIHHLQSVSPDCFWSIISPHESSATVTLPRLFRSHISTPIMTKNAPMQRKFNFGEDETIRSAFTASPEDDARPKLVVKKRKCYPDPVRHVCQVRIII